MISILGIFGLLALVCALLDLFSENSVSFVIISLILTFFSEGDTFGERDGERKDPPLINKYRHPLGFWSIFCIELIIGGFLSWPLIKFWMGD